MKKQVSEFGVKTCKPVITISTILTALLNYLNNIVVFYVHNAVHVGQVCIYFYFYVLLIIFVDCVFFAISFHQTNKSHLRDSICSIFIISASHSNVGQVDGCDDGGEGGIGGGGGEYPHFFTTSIIFKASSGSI